MYKHLVICLILFAGTADAQTAKTVKIDELLQLVHTKDKKIQVINFWATWCGPCVKELPLFEQVAVKQPNINVTLVSMDLELDPNPEKVHKFIERRKIKSQVLLLDERDPNSWINKISPEWTGAIPATLIVNPINGKRVFVERELHQDDLQKLISEVQ